MCRINISYLFNFSLHYCIFVKEKNHFLYTKNREYYPLFFAHCIVNVVPLKFYLDKRNSNILLLKLVVPLVCTVCNITTLLFQFKNHQKLFLETNCRDLSVVFFFLPKSFKRQYIKKIILNLIRIEKLRHIYIQSTFTSTYTSVFTV